MKAFSQYTPIFDKDEIVAIFVQVIMMGMEEALLFSEQVNKLNSGTLFLDEINLLDMTLQPKLLRVLQEKEIERVGGSTSIPVDVRIIIATNKSLEKLVQEKLFREDLFYRLNVIKIKIPPLRERLDDIELIFQDVLNNLNFELSMSIKHVDSEVYENLRKYDWPGNVRELHNVIERAMNISYGIELRWENFEEYFKNKKGYKGQISKFISLPKGESIEKIKDKIEKQAIKEALELNNNNKTKTAAYLGISRTTLYNKMKKIDR